MYKFIQKNQKKFLAVFAAGLMIVFVLPQFVFDQNRGAANEVVAHVGKDPIQLGEVRDAKEQWREIVTYLSMQLGAVSLAAKEIDNDPELFVLLQKEAEQMGLRASREQAAEALTMMVRQYRMFGQDIPNPSARVPAMQKLMLVRQLFERVAESIKLSDPVVLREMAANAQRVKLDIVHYSTADFEKDVPAPTPEQLQKQFDEFKNMTPGLTTDRNPFGFGYVVPSKVQLLYLTIPRDEIAQAVRKSKKEFDWKVDAMREYRTNPAKYAATQPSPDDEPASQPSTTQATQPATRAASGPTTKPFAEVHEQIVQELLKPETDRKVDEIAASLTDRMNSDYEAHQRKTSSAAADFGTRQYLERIAADIEKRFGVKLGVSEINDPKDAKGLAELKGIGQSIAGEVPFPRYVIEQAEPLLPPGAKKAEDVLSLDEPSRRFRDPAGNVYIAQLQNAEPAHPPANLDAVKEKVTADVRTRAAFDAAVAAAKKVYEQAAASGLEAAVKAAGKDLFTTPGYIDRQGNVDNLPVPLIPNVELPEASRQKLGTQAFDLLTQATPEKPHPAKLVELPAAGRVVIAELRDIERAWPDEQEDYLKYQVSQRLMMQRAERILSEYFRADAVKRRLEYRGRDDRAKQTPAAS
jgi:hypothetical protein